MKIKCCLTIAGGRLYWRTGSLTESECSDLHKQSENLCKTKEQERVSGQACTFVPDPEQDRVLLSWIDFNKQEQEGNRREHTTFRWHLVIPIGDFRRLDCDPFALARCAFFGNEEPALPSLMTHIQQLQYELHTHNLLPAKELRECIQQQQSPPNLSALIRAADGDIETLCDYLAALVAGLAGDLILDNFPVHEKTGFDRDQLTNNEQLLRSLYLALPYETRLKIQFSTYLHHDYSSQSRKQNVSLIALNRYGLGNGRSFRDAMRYVLEPIKQSDENCNLIARVRSEYVLPLFTYLHVDYRKELKGLQENYSVPNPENRHNTQYAKIIPVAAQKRCWPLVLFVAIAGIGVCACIAYHYNQTNENNAQSCNKEKQELVKKKEEAVENLAAQAQRATQSCNEEKEQLVKNAAKSCNEEKEQLVKNAEKKAVEAEESCNKKKTIAATQATEDAKKQAQSENRETKERVVLYQGQINKITNDIGNKTDIQLDQKKAPDLVGELIDLYGENNTKLKEAEKKLKELDNKIGRQIKCYERCYENCDSKHSCQCN